MKIRWRVIAVVLVAATLASIFSTSLAYQLEQQARQETIRRGLPPGVPPPPPADIVNSAILNSSFWFGWVVLSVPLVFLSTRWRVDRRPRVAVPIHVAAILVASFAHIALQTSMQLYTGFRYLSATAPEKLATWSFMAQWPTRFQRTLTSLIDWELITGAAIVAITHAYFYYRESQQRALETAQLQTKLVEAQLQALQSQLHPHFLFNTLHAISALMHRDVNAADRMLVQLSDLLRMTLNSVARPEVQLHEEMDFLAKYLQIEQVRLGERLTVEFDVDVNVLDAVVPALLLQPLVENAIKHGIAPHTKPGKVSVGAQSEGEMLVMTVSDTGPGPSERAMAALSTGIGVSNTRSRLAHQFGAHYRFEFHRQRDGFSVLVAIPLKHDPAVPASAAAHVA
jgi:two-component system LytT family sensor kinase